MAALGVQACSDKGATAGAGGSACKVIGLVVAIVGFKAEARAHWSDFEEASSALPGPGKVVQTVYASCFSEGMETHGHRRSKMRESVSQ
jgi:hypothetical protein